MPADRIHLIRHGETVLTPDRKFSGVGPLNPVLTETGRAQANAVAQAAATIDQANGIDLPSSARPEPGLGAESVGDSRESRGLCIGASVKNDETLVR